MSKLHRNRDGRMLCVAHAGSGAPTYHTPNCDACADAMAKGIVRPLASSVPKKKRGGMHLHYRHVGWDKVRRLRAARGEV